MNQLHVASHTGVFRGGAVQACRIARGQQERGHEITIVTNVDARASELERERDKASWETLRATGIEVRHLSLGRLSGRRELRRLAKSRAFRIVHAHRDEALIAAWLALWGIRGPKLVAQRGTTSAPKRAARFIFRSRRTEAVVAVSEAVRSSLAKTIAPHEDKIRVIYGSVDLEQFAPRPPALKIKEKLGIPLQAPVIGSLSAYRAAKGFDVLLPALRPLLEGRPELHVLFLGSRVAKRVEPLARELGLGARCHFVGHCEDVARWLSVMDVTVVAALEREGLSGVLRESLAMEVPVISSDSDGNGEIVVNRETGLLVPKGDARALGAAMEWALDNREEMKAMARRGRRWVERQCSVQAQAASLERLYSELLAR